MAREKNVYLSWKISRLFANPDVVLTFKEHLAIKCLYYVYIMLLQGRSKTDNSGKQGSQTP